MTGKPAPPALVRDTLQSEPLNYRDPTPINYRERAQERIAEIEALARTHRLLADKARARRKKRHFTQVNTPSPISAENGVAIYLKGQRNPVREDE